MQGRNTTNGSTKDGTVTLYGVPFQDNSIIKEHLKLGPLHNLQFMLPPDVRRIDTQVELVER